MPDFFQLIKPGDPIPTSAGLWNAMIAAAKAEQQRKADGGVAGPLAQVRSSTIVRVKNTTDDPVGRKGILGLDGPIYSPANEKGEEAFLREVAMKGVNPDSSHLGRFAVLLEPAEPQRVVRAVVAGVTQAKVDVLDSSERQCDCLSGDTGQLATLSGGSASILWREGDDDGTKATGSQWAIVRLSGAPEMFEFARIAKSTSSGIPAISGLTPGSDDVEWYEFSGSSLVDTGETFVACNLSTQAVGALKWLVCVKVGITWVVIFESCF